jgi:hypothetical protein
MTQERGTQETLQHGNPIPAAESGELTDAELDQVAGGGGDGAEGAQPTGSYR